MRWRGDHSLNNTCHSRLTGAWLARDHSRRPIRESCRTTAGKVALEIITRTCNSCANKRMLQQRLFESKSKDWHIQELGVEDA
jgi:hypothetical protein